MREIVFIPLPKENKTHVWQVILAAELDQSDIILGRVLYSSGWRRYCFRSAPGVDLPANALEKILQFVKEAQ